MNVSRIMYYFDWISCIITFLLAILGILFIFSATYTEAVPFSVFFKKQCIGLFGGALLYGILAFYNPRHLLYWGYVLYIGVVGLLIFTLLRGSVGMGAQRWIHLFFIKIQPSELAKALFPAFIAYHINQQKNYHFSWRALFPVIAMLCVSFVLIRKQPDLGTALVFLCMGGLLLWLAGMPKKVFLYIFLFVACAGPLIWHGGLLKEYQKKRIEVFLGDGEAHKERYQIEQAHIAIGSGALMGQGFLQGTQNKLHFLPEGRTDFIFAVLAEEMGFFGAVIILFLYMILFMRLLGLIQHLQDHSMFVLAVGIIAHIIISTFVNVGMVLGLLPVVGVPLPLMSYGLSNLWVTLASLGWLQSIIMHEFAMSRYNYHVK